MREIKFRGKRLDNGEWIFGSLFNFAGECEIADCNTIDYSRYDVDPATVGQYTGLKDKNGKEIWENDIVETPLLDPICGDILADAWCNAEIRFRNASFVVSYYKSSCNIYLQDLYDKIEVIGNIHDNFELLQS